MPLRQPSTSGGGNLSIATGSYTGDGNDDKAIAHGLGEKPKYVYIVRATSGAHWCMSTEEDGSIWNLHSDAHYDNVVKAMDSTYFYVGDSATGDSQTCNGNGTDYYWHAFA